MHIHQRCLGAVFSHDLFFVANGKEKCASMINGHDYLLRKCGFLAQQLHFYDLNLGQDASSWRQSCRQTAHRHCVVMSKRSTDKAFTISCLDRKVNPPVDCYVDI